MSDPPKGGADLRDLARILEERDLRTFFQPIVSLDDGEIVGYEALTCGPEGSTLELPGALFPASRAAGRLDELEQVSQSRAFERALELGLNMKGVLFLNAEPDTSSMDSFDSSGETRRAVEQLRIVIELTERALTARPAELLHRVRRVRELGAGSRSTTSARTAARLPSSPSPRGAPRPRAGRADAV